MLNRKGKESAKKQENQNSQKKKKTKSFKSAKHFPNACIFRVRCMPNNTFITMTDNLGNVLISKSAGCLGFKNNKKHTPLAATEIANSVCSEAITKGVKTIICLYVRGTNIGRESSIKVISKMFAAIQNGPIKLEDSAIQAHNGCRMRKQRKV